MSQILVGWKKQTQVTFFILISELEANWEEFMSGIGPGILISDDQGDHKMMIDLEQLKQLKGYKK